MNHPHTAAPAKTDRALRWPLFVVALLALNVCVCTVTVIAATRIASPAGAEPDYYQKAVDWEQTARQRAAADALGWTAALGLSPTADAGARRLTLVLRDAENAAIEDARVSAEIFHQARANARTTVEFGPLSGGLYTATQAFPLNGLYEVRLRIERDEQIMTRTETVDVTPAAEGTTR